MSDGASQDHVVQVEQLLSEIKMELESIKNWTICRVPANIRAESDNGYDPEIISIGPFHHNKENLFDMESFKTQYMVSFLKRTPQPERALKECGRVILSLDQRVRACYLEPIEPVATELAKIMLCDGCFILELLINNYMPSSEKKNDPAYWMIPYLQHDLALLENQIPFFVLEQLLETTKNLIPADYHESTASLPSVPLTDLAVDFLQPILNISPSRTTEIRGRIFHHLLHLVYTCSQPSFSDMEQPSSSGRDKNPWRRCLDLMIPGCFTSSRSNTKASSKGGVASSSAGTFKARPLFPPVLASSSARIFKEPPFFPHDLAKSLIRNLLAFEQCIPMF